MSVRVNICEGCEGVCGMCKNVMTGICIYMETIDDLMTSAAVSERVPTSYISCMGSKYTEMSTHPGPSFVWSLRSTASSAMRI